MLKINQSSFISTNRAGKNIERCINIPPINTPLPHVVTKGKGIWSPWAPVSLAHGNNILLYNDINYDSMLWYMCWVGSWVCEHFDDQWPLLFWQMMARIRGTSERLTLGQLNFHLDSWASLFFGVNYYSSWGCLRWQLELPTPHQGLNTTCQSLKHRVIAILLDSNILKRDSVIRI